MATRQQSMMRHKSDLSIFIAKKMFILAALLLTTLQTKTSTAVEVTRPRGVSLTKNVFYDPSRQFTCLDGSLTIPFNYVNDDYCDCNDGTDEPGTAACPNGVFHCTNAGHKPLNIPSSRVNDGICDCCDASDEYNSSSSCINFCKELGRKAREEAQFQMELAMKGFEVKQVYSKKGKELKEERKQRLSELERERDELSVIKDEKEAVKKAQEELEKTAIDKFNELKQIEEERKTAEEEEKNMLTAFSDLDVDQNGKLSLDEIKSRWFFDQDKDGVVSSEEAKFFLINKDEMDIEEYKSSGWALIKPQYSLQQMFTPPEEQTQEGDSEKVDSPEASQEEKLDIQPAPTFDELYRDGLSDEFLQPKHEEAAEDGGEDDDGADDEEDEESDSAVLDTPKFSAVNKGTLPPPTEAPPSNYDDETQALIDAAENARTEFREAERKFKDVESDVDKFKRLLAIDFGPEEEFGSLHEQCFDYTDREYTYTLCFFDKATQKSKNDGNSVNLGTWGNWVEEKNYSKMKYEHGLGCWNGPARTTEVRLSCGSENQVNRVSEPERCKYLFEVTTPVTCNQPSKQTDQPLHEEL